MFRIPFNPAPAKRPAHEQPTPTPEDPRLLNLRDRHPEMFTTRLGKSMPKHRRGQGRNNILGLSHSSVLARHA